MVTGSHILALLDRIQSEAPPELGCLNDCPRYTPRQREVVQLAHTGMSHLDIARELGITVHTVTSHLQAARAISNGVRYAGKGAR